MSDISKATGPVVTNFYKERPWAEGRKICSNSPGHMTKMATMPIHGKNLYKSSSLEPVDGLSLQEYYQDCSNNGFAFTLAYFTTRSNMEKI